jgi:hypothetical protein
MSHQLAVAVLLIGCLLATVVSGQLTKVLFTQQQVKQYGARCLDGCVRLLVSRSR